MIHTLDRTQCLPVTVEDAWTFFSSARNLDKITPPGMGFQIVSELTERPIYEGMEIEYVIKALLGIKMKWVTEIRDVRPPFLFKDTQLKGPYSLWEHTHRFEPIKGGVKMTDKVKYSLPLGWIGIIAHELAVKNKLKEIFDFRASTLEQLFGKVNDDKYVAG